MTHPIQAAPIPHSHQSFAARDACEECTAAMARAAALKVTPRVEGSPVTRTTIASRAASFMRVSADEIEASIHSMWTNGIMERDEAIVRATAEAVVAAMRSPEVDLLQEAVTRAETAEAQCWRLREALAAYVRAQGRMLDRWAEGDDAVKKGLWQALHACEEPARAALDRLDSNPEGAERASR